MHTSSVSSKWLMGRSRRLAARSYLSDFHVAVTKIIEFPGQKNKLEEVTERGRRSIFNGPRFSRGYVSNEQHGIRLLSGRSVLQSDLSWAPLIALSKAHEMPEMVVEEGTILITSYGTVGRVVYGGPLLAGSFGSDNVLKIVPDKNKIAPGYLFAYLSSSVGNCLTVKEAAGGVVTYIDPKNVIDLTVPRFSGFFENKIHVLVHESAELKMEFQNKIDDATSILFKAAGLQDISSHDWHAKGSDVGYAVKIKNSRSLRALNFNCRYKSLLKDLERVDHKLLGDICSDGQLSSGARFKRIDASPEFGVRLIGQKQGFWMKPEGRWISAARAPVGIFSKDETVMIASQGTLGEREVFSRPIFVTGKWLDYAYTQHFLRVYSGDPDISGAYLFAFLRSETAFRCLRSMSIGSKQQDIHVGMLAELPIPVIDGVNKAKVETLIREAFKAKDLADRKEQEAIAMVENAIDEAAPL